MFFRSADTSFMEECVKKTKKIALVLAGMLSATVSSYSLALCSLASGWYGGGNVGLTTAKGKSYPTSSSTQSSGKAWSANLGYKFTRYIAVEVDYTRYMYTRIRNSAGTTAARDNHYSTAATTKFILPIQNTGLELFAKLGLAYLNSQIGSINPTAAALNSMTFNTGMQTSTGAYWGLGAQYYFSPSISAQLQYAQARGGSKTGNLGIGSIGLSFLF
jgi:hypothetical protein